MKKALANLALSITALGFAYGLAELAVRALMADTSMLFPRYHTAYQYGPYRLRGIRPNEKFLHTSVDGRWEFVTNSAGFRNDRDFGYEKAPNVLRVLALGDSHTQGYEVRQEATYSEVLHRYLGAGKREVDVMNAGVSGFSTGEALAFLENEGYRYRPDVVVMGFFDNDYEDNMKAGLFDLDRQGQLVEKSREHVPGVAIQDAIYAVPGVKWLGEHSYFYSLLFNSVWEYFKGSLAASVKNVAAWEYAVRVSARGRREKAAKDTAANDVAPVEYAVPTRRIHAKNEIALTVKLIERMQAFCARQGIRLIVVDIPVQLQRYRIGTSLPVAVRERLQAANVEFIASERLFRSYADAVDFHVPHGHHHISEFSHALIGVELGRRILGK